MRRLHLLAWGALLVAPLYAQFSSTAYHIAPGSSLPATCSPNNGDIWFKTSATLGPYYCSAANTWSSMAGGGGGGTIATTTLPLKGDNAGNAVAVTGTCNSSTVVGGDGVCQAISTAFSILTSATNSQAAMVVGTGASLTVSGSGTINATSLGGDASALIARLASPTFTTPTLGAATATTINGIVVDATTPLGQFFQSNNNVTVAASSTVYFTAGASLTSNASVTARQWKVASNIKLKNLSMTFAGTQNIGGTLVCSINTVAAGTPTPSTITVTVSNADGANPTKTDTTHTESIAAGTYLSLGCINNYSGGVSVGVSEWAVGTYAP